MALYEHVVISRQDISPQQAEALNDQIKALIEEGGGAVAKIEYWGLRNLTYRIKKNRKGHYMLLGIDAPATALPEVDRQLGLNEDVLRSLTIRVEAIDEAPSAVLAKRSDDRGERSFRGPRPAGRFGSGRGRERGDDREEFRARPRDDLEGPAGVEE